MAADGNPGLNKLARVISKRAGEIAQKSADDIEPDFGVIGNEGSLTTNLFPIPIPKGEYHLTRLVSEMTELKAGDRVLVIWVQNEAVVVDAVIKS